MTLDFEDKNLPIPFKTTISKLTGEVSAVKNRANSTSNLEINGVVDNYGVAKITGIVNPNDIKLLTDVNMKFKNISMNNNKQHKRNNTKAQKNIYFKLSF